MQLTNGHDFPVSDAHSEHSKTRCSCQRGGCDWRAYPDTFQYEAAGSIVEREIDDDTLPDGPHRTIRYLAPFDRCDRETDYRIAWAAFARRALRAQKRTAMRSLYGKRRSQEALPHRDDT